MVGRKVAQSSVSCTSVLVVRSAGSTDNPTTRPGRSESPVRTCTVSPIAMSKASAVVCDRTTSPGREGQVPFVTTPNRNDGSVMVRTRTGADRPPATTSPLSSWSGLAPAADRSAFVASGLPVCSAYEA
jgi:hypothetical protein